MNTYLAEIQSTPTGSLLLVSESERLPILEKVFSLSAPLRDLLFSSRTGAYIRGLAKTYDLPENSPPKIAKYILEIVIGSKNLNSLSLFFSQDLGVPSQTAQKISQEIERDLFAPISLELNSSINQAKRFGQPKPATPPLTQPAATAQGVRNVVDLKQQTARPPMAPPIPPSVPPRVTTQSPALPSRPPTPETNYRVPSRPLSTPARSTPIKPPVTKSPLPFDKDSLKKKSQLWEAK